MRQDFDDPRREFLVQALGMGLFVSAGGLVSPAYGLGDIPSKLPPGRSIYKIKGSVTVDGVQADIKTPIMASSHIKTGRSSRVIFVVGTDAFVLRSNSELQLRGSGFLIEGMRMLTGRLLSVFGKRVKPHRIQTQTATIGIRGTGVYIESEAEKSYICTCYGHTSITPTSAPETTVEVETKYHDEPYYIYASAGKNGKIIRPAPVINHTDAELELIEQLVGRQAPFFFEPTGGY